MVEQPRAPRVRVVVLDHDGGAMTLRCLSGLRDVDWPAERLDVLLVDNGSTDGVAAVVRATMPWVRVLELERNLGFAGGCNAGMGDLDDVDYVALLNNDAVPERDWLRPLVATLESDRSLGAAASKILFARSYVVLSVETPSGARCSVDGLVVDGADVWEDAQFGDGCSVVATRGTGIERRCRVTGKAEIRVPVTPHASLPSTIWIRLAADRDTSVQLSAGRAPVGAVVGPRPAWHEVAVAGPAFDVVNNAGSCLLAGGYGADRGLLERDRGQYDEDEEIFAWCGGSVLLSSRYLRDVGDFDDRFFAYYEDTDLAWRGGLAGWRYRFVPASVVRHEHSATTGEGSAFTAFHVVRNRFLTLARNAPWPMVVDALYVYLRDTLVLVKRAVTDRRQDAPTDPRHHVGLRLRAVAAFFAMLPGTLRARRRDHATAAQRTAFANRWTMPR
jgi:GT2 family glycosyltransferase